MSLKAALEHKKDEGWQSVLSTHAATSGCSQAAASCGKLLASELSSLLLFWSLSVHLDACLSGLLSTVAHVSIVLRVIRTSCIWNSDAVFCSVASLLSCKVKIACG